MGKEVGAIPALVNQAATHLGPTGFDPGEAEAAGPGIGELLDRCAADDARETADHLEALRLRLGRDGLSMGEWNALVGAASDLRIEAWRRDKRAAIAMEARRAETGTGSVHDSAAIAQPLVSPPSDKEQ